MLSITKLQNLKAIHNKFTHLGSYLFVVINHKTTKFESNSQHKRIDISYFLCCYQSQNYKIWKQFTTILWIIIFLYKLLSITKLQNLKAIHNWTIGISPFVIVVINHKTTKFESNSQRAVYGDGFRLCCYQSQNYKIWKQFTTHAVFAVARWKLLQSQNYKIWKQFTTCLFSSSSFSLMLSITKLQNLKAIHNLDEVACCVLVDVINHKTTKFESNSQQKTANLNSGYCCYQSQNYKIWKQFTTVVKHWISKWRMLSITKLQNLKAIHNNRFCASLSQVDVINHKTTKFESNSQLRTTFYTYG